MNVHLCKVDAKPLILDNYVKLHVRRYREGNKWHIYLPIMSIQTITEYNCYAVLDLSDEDIVYLTLTDVYLLKMDNRFVPDTIRNLLLEHASPKPKLSPVTK